MTGDISSKDLATRDWRAGCECNRVGLCFRCQSADEIERLQLRVYALTNANKSLADHAAGQPANRHTAESELIEQLREADPRKEPATAKILMERAAAAIERTGHEPSDVKRDAERYRELRGNGVIFDAGKDGDGARRVFGIGLDNAVDALRTVRHVAQHEETGRMWWGPKDQIPRGYADLGIDPQVESTGQPPPALPDAVLNVAELLHTQDNRCTAAPIFIVQVQKRVYGIDTAWGGDVAWLHDGDEITEPEKVKELEAHWDEHGNEPDDYTRTGYTDQWEFVTACFTQSGCEAFLRSDGHNHRGEKRIYAHGSYRNSEWNAVRNYLKSLRVTGQTKESACVCGEETLGVVHRMDGPCYVATSGE